MAKPKTALVERLEQITEETARLARHETRTGAQNKRLADLAAEFDQVHGAYLRVDQDETELRVAEALRGDQGGTFRPDGRPAYRVEHGSEPPDLPGSPRHRVEARGRALDLVNAAEKTHRGVDRATLDRVAQWVEDDPTRSSSMAAWVLAAGSEAYRTAFHKMLTNPVLGPLEWTTEEREAFAAAQQYSRAVATDPASAGGVLVPFLLDPAVTLTGPATSNVGLRGLFTVRTIATDVWHGVSSAGVVAEWAAEAAEVAEASPTFTSPEIATHRGDCYVPFSVEVSGDVNGLEAELRTMMAEARANLEAASFITGTGTGQPRGLVPAAVAAGSVVGTGTADTLTLNDFYRVKAALPVRYRPAAAWLGSETVWDSVRQMLPPTDTRTWVEGTPPLLLGRTVNESSEMDSTADAGAANYLAAYGDLRAYVVVDRVGRRSNSSRTSSARTVDPPCSGRCCCGGARAATWSTRQPSGC